MKVYSLFFEKEKSIKIREEKLPSPDATEVLVKTRYSAISAGSELLFYRGIFPKGMETDLSIKALAGQMKYPLKYGYALVGEVIKIGRKVDGELLRKPVFIFHPHQSHAVVSASDVLVLPPEIDLRDALFLPNMETAVGLVMDARPLLGEKAIIFGQGIVGLLTTALLSAFPLNQLITVEPHLKRREISQLLGAKLVFDPDHKGFERKLQEALKDQEYSEGSQPGADLIFELSGQPEVLNSAISCASYQGRIIVGSWYGRKTASINLGDKFHRDRLQLISSQVSSIHPELKARWSRNRRLKLTWKFLGQLNPSRLISHQVPFSEAAGAYRLLDEHPEETVQIILNYEGNL